MISTTSQKVLPQGTNQSQTVEYDKTSKILHTVTESDLRTWLSYSVSAECRGRLTGDVGYTKSSALCCQTFWEWGLAPAGDNGTYFQSFSHPYTEVKPGGYFKLYLPVGNDWVEKTYDYPDDYMAGGTSESRRDKRNWSYLYRIWHNRSELHYDDYNGIDVKGKIVVCERDIPYGGNGSGITEKMDAISISLS